MRGDGKAVTVYPCLVWFFHGDDGNVKLFTFKAALRVSTAINVQRLIKARPFLLLFYLHVGSFFLCYFYDATMATCF
jgi:hypothetical protein